MQRMRRIHVRGARSKTNNFERGYGSFLYAPTLRGSSGGAGLCEVGIGQIDTLVTSFRAERVGGFYIPDPICALWAYHTLGGVDVFTAPPRACHSCIRGPRPLNARCTWLRTLVPVMSAWLLSTPM
jgi:hypothetical protein